MGDATTRAMMYRWRTPDGYYYPGMCVAARVHRRLQVSRKAERDARRIRGFLLLRDWRHARDGLEDGWQDRNIWRRSSTPRAMTPSMAERTTSCTCRPISRSKNFWSIILYDNQTRSMVQNDQQFSNRRPARTQGLLVNADGSVDLFRPQGSGWQGEKLGADHSWQELEHSPAPLRPTRALVQQDLAAGRDRTPRVIEDVGASLSTDAPIILRCYRSASPLADDLSSNFGGRMALAFIFP